VHDRRECQPRLVAAPPHRQLRQHELGGRERGPLLRRAARVRECKASAEDRPRPRRKPAQVAGFRVAGQVAALARELAKPVRAARLEPDRLTQRRKRVPASFRMLDADPAIAGPPRGEDGRGRVQLGIGGDRERCDARAARSPRALDGCVDALAKSGE
jgi:hypothetical protein